MLDKQMIQIVQSSWKQIEDTSPKIAALFYQNLFELEPSLRDLFAVQMTEQSIKLAQVLDATVSLLGDRDLLAPILQDLGERHRRYGVTSSHYIAARDALLKTIEQEMGSAFTLDVQRAWQETYEVISSTMQGEICLERKRA